MVLNDLLKFFSNREYLILNSSCSVDAGPIFEGTINQLYSDNSLAWCLDKEVFFYEKRGSNLYTIRHVIAIK